MNINFVLPSCGPKKLEAFFLAKNDSFLLKMASRYDSEEKICPFDDRYSSAEYLWEISWKSVDVKTAKMYFKTWNLKKISLDERKLTKTA